MSTLNGVMVAALKTAGYDGALNGMLHEWLGDQGATAGSLNGRWLEFLNGEGITAGTINDRLLAYYKGLGAPASSTLNGAALYVWTNSPPTVP